MQTAMANTTGHYAHANLTLAGLVEVCILDNHGLTHPIQNRGLHCTFS
jgi:hypothetical protein